jgi:hypothetical protein
MTIKSKSIELLLLLATFGVAAMALPQADLQTTQSPQSAVRIVRPRTGQVLANNFVALRFELVRPNPAGGGNNFVIQLDSRDAVNTSENEYTFTGMRPGQHTIAVTEVDANGTPLPDARAEVQFTVAPLDGTAKPAQSNGKAASDK